MKFSEWWESIYGGECGKDGSEQAWDAALEHGREKTEATQNSTLCDSCNMINCKIRRDYGIEAVKCGEYMEGT